jgi:cell wall-associated NlpC family hydrolase
VTEAASNRRLCSARSSSAGLLFALLALVLGLVTAPPAESAAGTDRLYAGEDLRPGHKLRSPSGAFELIMQFDGNLVLYGPGGAHWHTFTHGHHGSFVRMQGDGNFVMYAHYGTHALWNTGTHQRGGDRLLLQNDGNLVVYTAAGVALWDRMGHVERSRKRSAVVEFAMSKHRQPYYLGYAGGLIGDRPHWDCSGLAQEAWRQIGAHVHLAGRTSYRQSLGAAAFHHVGQLQPGDLVFYQYGAVVDHVAVYIGNGQVIEAWPSPRPNGVGGSVRIVRYDEVRTPHSFKTLPI